MGLEGTGRHGMEWAGAERADGKGWESRGGVV